MVFFRYYYHRHHRCCYNYYFLSGHYTVGVNSDCDFLLFITAQPSNDILQFSQTQVGVYASAANAINSDTTIFSGYSALVHMIN